MKQKICLNKGENLHLLTHYPQKHHVRLWWYNEIPRLDIFRTANPAKRWHGNPTRDLMTSNVSGWTRKTVLTNVVLDVTRISQSRLATVAWSQPPLLDIVNPGPISDAHKLPGLGLCILVNIALITSLRQWRLSENRIGLGVTEPISSATSSQNAQNTVYLTNTVSMYGRCRRSVAVAPNMDK